MTPYNYATQTAKELVYKHMKLNDIKSKYYNYHSFFDYYSEEFDIAIIEYLLPDNVSGFSTKDINNCWSITFQKKHFLTRQNFTKCHELGHFLLNHKGHEFSLTNKNPICEREANYFASFVLAPDIVLLFKIAYENQSFKSILDKLEISKDCLEIRLSHLLKDYTNLSYKEIELTITNFQSNKNREIALLLYNIKDNIILEYQNTDISSFDKALHLLSKSHYFSSISIEELVNNDFQNKLKLQNNNLKFNSHFDYGKTTFYAWDTRFLDSKQALNKTKIAQFDNHFLKHHKRD